MMLNPLIIGSPRTGLAPVPRSFGRPAIASARRIGQIVSDTGDYSTGAARVRDRAAIMPAECCGPRADLRQSEEAPAKSLGSGPGDRDCRFSRHRGRLGLRSVRDHRRVLVRGLVAQAVSGNQPCTGNMKKRCT